MIDWLALQSRYSLRLVQEARRLVRSGGAVAVRPQELATSAGAPIDHAVALLVDFVSAGVASAEHLLRCMECGADLASEQVQEHECQQNPGARPVVEEQVFWLRLPKTRDVKWLVAVHGMNTHGAWQEEFSWVVQIVYGYSIPTFIFKYGRILLSPFLDWRQEKYVDEFANRLLAKASEVHSLMENAPPDILAHSFGTWIVARALEKHEALRYGRVILTGSIVRPDFDWGRYVAAERVESVLCHRASRDIWVRVAPFSVPRSGPSGIVGFGGQHPAVHEILSQQYHHVGLQKVGTSSA
jgi:hypothetical protein